ncbi:hypothetical protein C7447_102514 [Tenacibaculum adriaticum]|uniref:Lipoprotein n=1 Tax=Tenacibaculum adriaticum TaxID=413713 RepID=A0A5S5DTC3_9FLAO|nr:hypothetical protein [Tenacibaculum adriaticum]TYP99193.1 hypothetical protein C7447_102514 [Tenacibaculum adriaticum]
MKKITLLFLITLTIVSCSSVKSTQKAINSGNYDKAISLSIENLKKNKTKEKNQPYVEMLVKAFKKVKERDEARIAFLKKENRPENLESILNLYQQLNNRQERIKPLLPLKVLATGRNAEFKMRNYDDELIATKAELSEYLYNNAASAFNDASQDKYRYRAVFEELQYLDRINPNYKDTKNLMDEAHDRGTDFVYVLVKNETRQVIPRRLEEDLLAMDTYGLNDLWTVYHAQKNRQIKYDYNLELNLRRIDISPEQIHEKEIIKEKQIKDGYKYLYDEKGNIVKDSLGNKIKVDKFKKIRCRVYKFTQNKSSSITGVVKYIDNYSRQLLKKFPIQSEFIFEHAYANYDGDRRALDDSFTNLIQLKEVYFPSNEQMIYDTGTDLKEKLKYIITRNKFNR